MDEAKSYIELTTLSVIKHLEKKTGVCQLKNETKLPAEKQAVAIWEQKNTLLLPDDLKSFYLTTNGFDLTWSVKMEKMIVPVGKMHVNNITSICKLESVSGEGTHVQPSLWDLDMDEDNDNDGHRVPSFVDSRIYELDPCDGYGKVCLVYQEVKPEFITEIWFLDRSLHWHFICEDFLSYYRLMLMHLGIPHWQYAFTDMGLPPHSKQWFNVYAPIRLEVDIEGAIETHQHDDLPGKTQSTPLDFNKIFKGKTDRKKTAVTSSASSNPPVTSTNANSRRRFPVSSARSSTSVNKSTAASNQQAMQGKLNKM